MEKFQFQEVLFNRIETKETGATKEESKLTVSFERVKVMKQVRITDDQAKILNAGRSEHPGNTSFTLFLKDGDSDPQPIVKTMEKAKRPRK